MWQTEPETRKSSQTLPSALSLTLTSSHTLHSLMGLSFHAYGPILEEGPQLAPCPVLSPYIQFHTVARVLLLHINPDTVQVMILLKILSGTHSFWVGLLVVVFLRFTYFQAEGK